VSKFGYDQLRGWGVAARLEKFAKLIVQNANSVLPLQKYFRLIMFAIVNIAGQQFKVRKDDELFVHRLEGNAGDSVEFSEILMVSVDGNIKMSTKGTTVRAEIMNHLQGDKVIVFKKKRRKGYMKKNGHRQSLTQIRINEIA
jgi:large subunit ribosomal protein L21